MICRTQNIVEVVPKCGSKCLKLKVVEVGQLKTWSGTEKLEVGHWNTWSGWSGSLKNLKWLKWVTEKLEVGHWKTWSGWSGSMYMKWVSKQLYIMSEYWQNEANSCGWSGWSWLQWVLDAPHKYQQYLVSMYNYLV